MPETPIFSYGAASRLWNVTHISIRLAGAGGGTAVGKDVQQAKPCHFTVFMYAFKMAVFKMGLLSKMSVLLNTQETGARLSM